MASEEVRETDSVWRIFVGSDQYVPPSPLEDLPAGIKFAHYWVTDPRLRQPIKDRLHIWAADATAMLENLSGPPLKPAVLPPANCKRCNFYNEYVGPEHLVNGEYLCRPCKQNPYR